jgi:hypothetical protein
VRRWAKQLNSPFFGVLQSCSTAGLAADVAVPGASAALLVAACAAGKPAPMTAMATAVSAANRADILRAADLDRLMVGNV